MILVFIVSLFVYGNAINAQNVISVQSGNTATVYSSLDSTLNHANTGDYVYIPGGSYNVAAHTINQGINLVGSGYYLDSTLETGLTEITGGPFTIISGADNASFTGILFYNFTIQFGTNSINQNVNNFSITRCRLSGGALNLGYTNSPSPTSTNMFFSENIFENSFTINGNNIQGVNFLKNIFAIGSYNFLANFYQSTFNIICKSYILLIISAKLET